MHFNPRTHVGCDVWRSRSLVISTISIHAPTWGATIWYAKFFIGSSYFNPRTHVGCDVSVLFLFVNVIGFQSTHPRGVRRVSALSLRQRNWISIHAPTWGATPLQDTACHISQYFNPRTHVGCDLVRGAMSFLPTNFNPRTHVGCDTSLGVATLPFQDFNPRTHVGCDPNSKGRYHNVGNFNPRTHVGCDPGKAGSPRSATNFNPRTHVGCDSLVRYINGIINHFNPRTHVGCDAISSSAIQASWISIHAPTWGAT